MGGNNTACRLDPAHWRILSSLWWVPQPPLGPGIGASLGHGAGGWFLCPPGAWWGRGRPVVRLFAQLLLPVYPEPTAGGARRRGWAGRVSRETRLGPQWAGCARAGELDGATCRWVGREWDGQAGAKARAGAGISGQ